MPSLVQSPIVVSYTLELGHLLPLISNKHIHLIAKFQKFFILLTIAAAE